MGLQVGALDGTCLEDGCTVNLECNVEDVRVGHTDDVNSRERVYSLVLSLPFELLE